MSREPRPNEQYTPNRHRETMKFAALMLASSSLICADGRSPIDLRLEFGSLPKSIESAGSGTFNGTYRSWDDAVTADKASRFGLYGVAALKPAAFKDTPCVVLIGGGVSANTWTYSDKTPGERFDEEISTVFVEGHAGLGVDFNKHIRAEVLGTLGFGSINDDVQYKDPPLTGEEIHTKGSASEVMIRTGLVFTFSKLQTAIHVGYFYAHGYLTGSGSLAGARYSASYDYTIDGAIASFSIGLRL